jgi:hypothetical protein
LALGQAGLNSGPTNRRSHLGSCGCLDHSWQGRASLPRTARGKASTCGTRRHFEPHHVGASDQSSISARCLQLATTAATCTLVGLATRRGPAGGPIPRFTASGLPPYSPLLSGQPPHVPVSMCP